ncbi:MAG: serine hydrolase domain-containing protein [Gemmatimonadales bacterium]
MQQRHRAIVVLALAALGSAFAPRAVSAQTLRATIDSLFAPLDRTDGPGCTVGVDHRTERVTRAYGMANLEHRLALGPESVLETGSVAKQFTAAALVLLEQRGKLSLDDDIRKHLPEVPDFGAPITIRHLLTHTSGLRDQWGLLVTQGFPPGREVHTFERILALIAKQRALNFPTGAEYLYSNTGYALAAVIVTRVAGVPFAEFSRTELFEPLGMRRTEWRADYRKIVPDRATAYEREGPTWIQDMPFTQVHGNGGLLTTVGDMLIWNAALTAGTVPGGAALVRALETPMRLNDGSEIDYALGLSVGRYRGLREVSHGGATAGYRTYLARWPERDLSVAIFCNDASVNPAEDAHRLARRVLELPDEEPSPSAPVALAPDQIDRLAGNYRDPAGDQIIRLGKRDGRLAVLAGPTSLPLEHLGNLEFWSERVGRLRFEPEGDGYRVVRFANAWRRYRPMPPMPRDSVPLAPYLGRYRSPELDVVLEIGERNGRMVVDHPMMGAMTVIPLYPDGFGTQGRTFRFRRDRRGRVTGFELFAGRILGVEFERLPAESR